MQDMPRRANLNGRMRADGRWEIRVTLTRLDGAKTRKSVYGNTLAECQSAALRLIHETGRIRVETMTVNDLAKEWEATWAGRLAPKTIRAYRQALDLVILPYLGERECHTLTTPTIFHALKRCKAERLRGMGRTVLGTMLAYGRLIGALDGNPLEGLRLPALKPKRGRITEDELQEILDAMPERVKPFFRVLAETGLRPWREGIVMERDALQYRLDTWCLAVPDSKTRSGVRLVPIESQDLAHALEVMEGRLFPLSESTYKRAWKAAGGKCEIYALRRYAITRWCESGNDLDTIKTWAGHSDLRLTLDVYNEVQSRRLILSKGVKKGVKVSDMFAEDV